MNNRHQQINSHSVALNALSGWSFRFVSRIVVDHQRSELCSEVDIKTV